MKADKRCNFGICNNGRWEMKIMVMLSTKGKKMISDKISRLYICWVSQMGIYLSRRGDGSGGGKTPIILLRTVAFLFLPTTISHRGYHHHARVTKIICVYPVVACTYFWEDMVLYSLRGIDQKILELWRCDVNIMPSDATESHTIRSIVYDEPDVKSWKGFKQGKQEGQVADPPPNI